MFQADSPWHAGAPGWKTAPWPGWGENPNLVGPPRLAVDGLGAYHAPKYETPIAGLGASCGCSAKPVSGLGALTGNQKGALLVAGAGALLIGMAVFPNLWDG